MIYDIIYMIRCDMIRYDTIRYYMIWYDAIRYDIWYDIYLLQLGFHSVAAVGRLVRK